MSVVDELLRADIGVHSDLRGGENVTAGIGADVLRWMGAVLQPGMRTLEIGCGLTTAIFAASDAKHVCISPFPDEHRRINEWCKAHEIGTNNVRFLAERSDIVLPTLVKETFEFVLVDGSHAFPHAFIDFWYASLTLPVEGLVVIDDTQIWTGRVLHDFLNAQPEWQLEREWAPKTSAFRRIGPSEVRGAWTRQPYVTKRSICLTPGLRAYISLVRHGRYRWAGKRAAEAAGRRIDWTKR